MKKQLSIAVLAFREAGSFPQDRPSPGGLSSTLFRKISMIELTRKQIRTIRSTIRQSLGITSARKAPTVTLRAAKDQLRIQAATQRVAIECWLPGNYQSECFAIPYEALSTCEGRQDDRVSFSKQDETIVLRWTDAGIPQAATFAATDAVEMPTAPITLSSIEPQFLSAMAEAVATTDRESTRYALDCIRLRGRDGQIAATDSCQALVQIGYSFPWTDEVLVPASDAFTSIEFAAADGVLIGRSEDWLTIQANSNVLHLRIDKESRFPNIDLQIPTGGAASTTLSLCEDDIDFLLTSTKRLPGGTEPNSPVTVELNGVVAVRAEAMDQTSSTELVLSNSRRTGNELCFNTNRAFLTRAAKLGFREIQLRNDQAPAYCQDERRTYIWALLGEEGSFKASAQTIRISSPVTSTPNSTQKRTNSPMATPQSTTTQPAPRRAPGASPGAEPDAAPNLLSQAESLRDSLSQALGDTVT